MVVVPLVVANLTSSLAAVFASYPASGALAAQQLAMAYDSYCKTGMAPPGMPIFTGTEMGRLQAALLPALSAGNGTAAAVGAAWASGINSYWTTPPVPFVGGPAAGVVTVMPGAASAAGPITAALQNVQATAQSTAQAIATALDVATKTVLVTYSTPPPPAGPPPPAMVM